MYEAFSKHTYIPDRARRVDVAEHHILRLGNLFAAAAQIEYTLHLVGSVITLASVERRRAIQLIRMKFVADYTNKLIKYSACKGNAHGRSMHDIGIHNI